MKILFAVILIFFNFLTVKGQTEYIVAVNPATAAITKIDSIPGVRWLQNNSGTYNESSKEYTVIGLWDLAQPTAHLYTLNTLAGNVTASPIIAENTRFKYLRYSRSTGKLYGITYENGLFYLVAINKTLGTYSIIANIQNINAVTDVVIDETDQQMFLRGLNNNPAWALLRIDLVTGTTISRTPVQNVLNFAYDNSMHKIYALSSRPGSVPGSTILSLCTLDPTTGNAVVIADIPNAENVVTGDYATFDENHHIYFFAGAGQTPGAFLYSINVITGAVISNVQFPYTSGISLDNLIFFRYDNDLNKLYALFWEAHTSATPPIAIDSSCSLVMKTKIYPNPFNDKMIIDKNPTNCKVIMNLYNILGQLILENRIINDGHNEILLTNLSASLYYYKFISGNSALLEGKILKQ